MKVSDYIAAKQTASIIKTSNKRKKYRLIGRLKYVKNKIDRSELIQKIKLLG